MTPDDRLYTKTHEWIKLEHGSAVVGITDYAQEALGEITFIELPVENRYYAKSAECGVIESVKAASDFYAPVSGEIVEVNNLLEDKPETVNADPYGKGWLFRMENIDAAQVKGLMSAAQYEDTLEEAE